MTEFNFENPPNMQTHEGIILGEWLSRQFLKVSDAFVQTSEEIAANAPGYGDGGLITRVATPMPNIAVGSWATVPFDSGQVANPVFVTQDPANNRFSVDVEDTWFFTFYIVFLCDKNANTDRIINWRVYNETTGLPYSTDPFPIPVENNANFGQSSASTLVEVAGPIVGDWLRIELGGSAKAFSGIQLEKAGIALIRVQTP